MYSTKTKKKIGRLMRKLFRGQFWGELWHSKLLPTSLTTQVQTAKCYREAKKRCIYVWHYCTCLQIYKLSCRTQWHFQQLELFYILHKRIGLHPVQESCQCIFVASCHLEINPRVCCYQTELVNWIGFL